MLQVIVGASGLIGRRHLRHVLEESEAREFCASSNLLVLSKIA
jgi:hypothetical protein